MGRTHEKSTHPGVVTLSLGVATVSPVSSMTHDDLIGMADKALYAAKEKGRNRVEAGDV